MEPITSNTVNQMLGEHRTYFEEGHTLSVDFRIQQLRALQTALQRNEPHLTEALRLDLGKSAFEAYATEIGFCYHSLTAMIRHLRRWAKPKRVHTPLYLWPSSSVIYREPYGTALIIGPFNYPVQLLVEPLIGAIAGGNCAILKPSENTPHVADAFTQLIREAFDERYIRVVRGNRDATGALINAPFDYLFFTGSVPVGKVVMQAAATNLVPVTLELGGKSPAIVDQTADLTLAARRIVWGKFLNAGQTCIAPDYVLADARIKDELVRRMQEAIVDYYGADPIASPDYGRIVNGKQFDRLADILAAEAPNVLYGGQTKREDNYIAPTLLAAQGFEGAAMQDELFGPLLPILAYPTLEDAIRIVRNHPKPLALYLFTTDKAAEKQVLSQVSFGGGCINETISHVANPSLPFGGVGNAGMGSYHGKQSFDLFTHAKSVLHKSSHLDAWFTTPPYGNKLRWVRKILK